MFGADYVSWKTDSGRNLIEKRFSLRDSDSLSLHITIRKFSIHLYIISISIHITKASKVSTQIFNLIG